MKKKFTILITAAFMLLTMMATTGRMWGQEATLSFTSNSWGLPEGSNAGIQGPASYISGNDTITLYASTKFYYNTSDKYLLFGKTNSTLTLPKFSFDVEKIEVVGRNGASGSVKQNIYVGNNAVSTETTGATGTNTYMISSNYQTAGNVYVLKVTSNHNTQVTSIKIYKKQETSVATPTFSPEGGTYTEAQTVTISCDTQNVDIYYTTDGSTPDDESTQYNGSITVSESMTIKAIAYDSDDNASSVATAVYTIQQPLSTMDEIFAAATAAGNTATTVIINFDNWVVTGVKNKNAYVTDGTKGFIIYQDGHGFSVGDVLSGTATCKVQLYNGSSEITTLTATTTGLTVTSGGAVTPATNISIADLTGVNTGAVLSYDNLTYNGTALVDANDNTITPYNTLYSYTFVNGKSYNVKGIYLQYNSTKELLPRSADDIEVVDTEVADPVFSPAAGTYADTQTVTMSCTTEGAAIHYTTDGTEPDGNSTQYSEPISVTAATTFKAKAIKGDDASAVITATYHICSAENPYTVAQALAFHEYPTSIIWVHGIVSTAPTAAPNNGQLTYYISDNGEATNQLQVYKGKGLNNAAFTTQDDIQVGDIVTITGIVKIYNTTTEFDAGNYLTSFERPAVPSISADDVALTYDATSCVIEYEISNFVDGEMSATTEATWISDFTYDPADEFGEVGFTATVNDGAARQATVTLTYTYNTNEIVTKDVTVSQAAAPVPSISVDPAIVNAPATETDGTITVTLTAIYNNEIEVQWFESDGTTAATYDWIEAVVDPNNDIAYLIEENTGDARSAYFKVYGIDGEANDVYSELVTINQEAYVAPTYAELPFAFNGGKADIENTDGLSQEGLGSDYNATSNPTTKLKFDGTGDWLLLQFQERPGTLTFNIKGNGFSGSTFKVQTSEDGITYTDLETYTELGDTQNESFDNLGENVRYIKWIYTEKSSGNVGLGNIVLAAYAEPVASITVADGDANIDVDANGVENATLAIAYENLTITDPADFDIQYYNANGDELGKDDEPIWMAASIQENATQDGYEVLYDVFENDGEARTAYFKVFAMDDNSDLVYSNLVTISQEAYVAPTATITVADGDANIDVDANGVENATLAIAYENLTITDPADFDIQYYNANGDELGKDDEPIWMAASIQENATQDGYEVLYDVFENDGEARTAYFKVFAMGDQDFVYSNLVTINQAAYVVDYATLPFEWEGGTTADFNALNGTSTNSVGDYGDNQGVYRMKLDGTGDYIQVKTNEQPGVVTIGVKMIGGATTSTLTIQGSADGETFTNVDTLTISGKQNDVLNLETTEDFATTDRYVRLYFTKGSNVGVGPITITKYTTDPIINAEDVDLAYDATSGEIAYTITNPVAGKNLEATTSATWISNIAVSEEKVSFTTTANEGSEDRVATFTLTYEGAADKTVIVTQAHFVIDYATIPFAYDGNGTGELPVGLTPTGLGTYNSSPKMKFDGAGDNLILKLDAAPTSLSYDIKGNGSGSDSWAGTFKVQTSADGETYEDLVVYENNLGATQSITHINLASTVRYIKWVYVTKTTGNVALGNIHASDEYEIYGDMTINSDDLAAQPVIVHNGSVVTFVGTNTNAADLIIEDGGQLIHDNDGLLATIQRNVKGYNTNRDADNSGYMLIASPVANDLNVADQVTLISGAYDLYSFDQSKAGEEWRNYKAGEFSTIENEKGYLYANANNDTISFAGALKPSNSPVTINLDYTAEKPFSGWNLIGNPFACNAYLIDTADMGNAFYRMNSAGNGFTAVASGTIAPMEGIFVKASAASQSFKFTREAPSSSAGKGDLNIQVAQVTNTRDAQSVVDNAIIRFDGGSTLQKFSFRDDNAKVYFTRDNKDYAVVNAQAQGEMPINFKAAENGTYTIDFSMDNVEFNYLHLIDNKTGMDIDLMQTSSYTFEASKTDYASRFRLLFSTNGNENSNENNDFGFFDASGNLLVLGIEGKATLQLIDVTGRILSSETFSGNYSKALNASAGVYMLRLIQGNDVRTQKIVVK